MSIYDWFIEWTAKKERTDVWRAVIVIVVTFTALFVLFGLSGCVSTGPSMTLATSHRGDGIARLHQNVYENGEHECFVEYEHHSEIFKETNEDTFDAGLVGCTIQFGDWK